MAMLLCWLSLCQEGELVSRQSVGLCPWRDHFTESASSSTVLRRAGRRRQIWIGRSGVKLDMLKSLPGGLRQSAPSALVGTPKKAQRIDERSAAFCGLLFLGH